MTPAITALTDELATALAAPFEFPKWVVVAEGKGDSKNDLYAPYLDRNDVQDRLDAVVGAGSWSFDIEAIPGSPDHVIGRLTVLGVTKADIGDGADATGSKLKAAASDALKRAAVHFGIGRHLPDQKWMPKGTKNEPKKRQAPAARPTPAKAAPTPRKSAPPTPKPAPNTAETKLPVATDPIPFGPETGEPTWGQRLHKFQADHKLSIDDILDLLKLPRLVPGDDAASFRKYVVEVCARKECDREEAYRLIYNKLKEAVA